MNGPLASWPDDFPEVRTATNMTPTQISTNVLVPGNGTLHTRIRCRYYLASAANATATPSVLDGDA